MSRRRPRGGPDVALFDRVGIVEVGPAAGGSGLSWPLLDLNFGVVKTDTPEPNKATVELLNLARASRSYLLQPNLSIIIKAGYSRSGGARVLFRGDIDVVTHDVTGETKRTTVQALDGKRARGRRLLRSYGPGSTLRTIVDDLIATLGIPRGETSALSALTGEKVGGLVVSGSAGAYLDRLLASSGLRWSIQDGTFTVFPEGQALSAEAVLLSPSSGLIGSPEPTTEEDPRGRRIPGLQVTSLLDPLASPGLRVKVDSEYFKGVYRTRTVEHRGTTTGQEWYTIRDLRE